MIRNLMEVDKHFVCLRTGATLKPRSVECVSDGKRWCVTSWKEILMAICHVALSLPPGSLRLMQSRDAASLLDETTDESVFLCSMEQTPARDSAQGPWAVHEMYAVRALPECAPWYSWGAWNTGRNGPGTGESRTTRAPIGECSPFSKFTCISFWSFLSRVVIATRCDKILTPFANLVEAMVLVLQE